MLLRIFPTITLGPNLDQSLYYCLQDRIELSLGTKTDTARYVLVTVVDVVCVGGCWAAPLHFFVRVLLGDFFSVYRGRSGVAVL